MATSAANCWPLAGLLSSNRIHILNMCPPSVPYLGTLIVIISSFAGKIDVLVHIYFSGLSTCSESSEKRLLLQESSGAN